MTHNTQRLNASLFRGRVIHVMRMFMNMFYNAVLPVQSRSTGAYVYHLPLGSPRHKAYMADNDFKCCSGSCAEAFAKLNNGIYYHDDSAVYVNLYVPSKCIGLIKRSGWNKPGDFGGTDSGFHRVGAPSGGFRVEFVHTRLDGWCSGICERREAGNVGTSVFLPEAFKALGRW